MKPDEQTVAAIVVHEPVSPIMFVKLNAVEAIARDQTLSSGEAWSLIRDVLYARGWEIYHVLRRQGREADAIKRGEPFAKERNDG